jgi:hypothetical protein
MKKLLLCLLVLVSTAAQAQWTFVRENAQAKYYFNYSSLKANASTRRVWILQDLKAPSPIPDAGLSGLALYEFNCQDDSMRIISIKTYSGRGLTGQLVSSGDMPTAPWQSIPPTTTNEFLLRTACEFKLK